MELSCRLPRELDAAALGPLNEVLARRTGKGVIVLRGSSGTCFCDGMNLRAARAAPVATPSPTSAFAETLLALVESPLPTVAVVVGSARGGGVGLAAACDVVIADRSATFALPELLYGLAPAMIWPILRRRVSEARLRRWALTALAVQAGEAELAGLVDAVVDESELDGAVRRQVRLLSRMRSRAVVRLRQLTQADAEPPLSAAVRRGAEWTARWLEAPDVRQALEAFEQGDAPWLD